MAIKLTRAKTPEEVGVSSKVVNDCMNAIEAENVNIHSFMVIRHGKVAAECYRAPFTADRPHAMYSVSKTFTATAIGIAEGEGLLSMNDLVKDYFPDYTKDLNDPRLERLTIRHLITMSSAKASMRRTRAPSATTSGSLLSMPIICGARIYITIPRTPISPAPSEMLMAANRRASCCLPAPRLWPISVVDASSMPYPGM